MRLIMQSWLDGVLFFVAIFTICGAACSVAILLMKRREQKDIADAEQRGYDKCKSEILDIIKAEQQAMQQKQP